MNTISSLTNLDARRASRAIGAMFVSVFGGAWLSLWSYLSFGMRPIVLGFVAIGTATLFFWAALRYRQYRDALAVDANSLERRRTIRIFNIINAVQWILIIIAANVFPLLGMASWIIPFIIFIIGLHFLPLAHLFSNRSHYVTGSALMLLASVYPVFSQAGPADPIGCLGTGIILWISAVWGLSTNPSFRVAGAQFTAD